MKRDLSTTGQIDGNILRHQQDGGEVTIIIESPAWFAWLENANSFTFRSDKGHFTAHKSRAGNRRGGSYWRATRRVHGRLYSFYLGSSAKLSFQALYDAATELTLRAEEATLSSTLNEASSGVPGTVHTDFLLATKLHIPRLPVQHIARPHLRVLLEEGARRPFTLVAAPAGSGKTTLLAEWAMTTSLPIRWLSLEAAENDPARLLSYLIAALNPLAGRPETSEQGYEPIVYPNWEPVLTRVLNILTRDLKQDAALILDDYHLLTSEIAHTILSFLIEHLPTRLHLVIGTRVDPQWSLARLRAHNQLYEVRSTDLGFTLAEMKAFTCAMGMDPSEETTCLLEKITEGWVAGVQLLTLALRGRQDAARFLAQSGSMHHFLQAYISEEILQQQTPQMQRFLLFTSILDRLCGPLCDALLGETEGKRYLEELRKANLFISALDEMGSWYRYHPLFAEALQHHLRAHEPEHIPELYSRASHWHEEQGWVEEACEYALLADDQPRAARLVERLMPHLIKQGKFLRLRTWLERLSPEVVTGTPLLFLASLGASLLSIDNSPTNLGQVTSILSARIKQQMERHAQDNDSRWADLGQGLILVQAIEAMVQGNVARALALTHEAAFASVDANSELSQVFEVLRKIILSNAYGVSGNLEAAERLLLESSTSGDPVASPLNLARFPSLVNLYEAQGRLRELGSLFEMLLRTSVADDTQPLILHTMMRARYASLLYEWNQLAQAEAYARQALEDNQHLDIPIPLVSLLCLGIQLRVALARGEREQAQQLLSREEFHLEQYEQYPAQGRANSVAAIARVTLMSEEPEAERYWEYLTGLRVEDRLTSSLTMNDYEIAITLARSLLTHGRKQHNGVIFTQALALLEQLEAIATTMGSNGWLLEIQVVTAMVLQAQGKVKRALKLLGQALARAEAAGYIRLFADEGQPMALLLKQIDVYTTASPGYIRQIQGAIQLSSNHSTLPIQPKADSPLPEALSPREQEVLALLSQGLSNQQIAERLIISLNTAKRHVKHLLAKLAVTNRTQAVARARELHLL